MEEIKKIKQLIVTVKDKPGELAELTGCLSKEKININAFCAYVIDGDAVFYVICDDNEAAKAAFIKKGLQVKEDEVVVVSLQNKIGALSEVSAKLKAKNINLVYCYGSACECSCPCQFVFKAQDNDKAIAALK